MRLTVLGGCGGWPAAGRACSGYLIEAEGWRLLIDPGYATLPRLLSHVAAEEIDAVVVSHGHPDHCADLNPLLRARALREDRPPSLPVYTPPGALEAVLALDRPGMLDGARTIHEITPGDRFGVGPFTVRTWSLPHWTPNVGMRLEIDGTVLAYTGDTGPCEDLVELARDADLFLAEATYPEDVPADSAAYLSSARQAGEYAAGAEAGRLVLTHLWPGTRPEQALEAARRGFPGPTTVAYEDLAVDLPTGA